MFTIAGDSVLEGRYELKKRLGQGGMGAVYEARHIFLKTIHAIKIILPEFLVGNDPEFVRRFRQEAMAAANIRHPNVIRVTDYGIANGNTPFLVMDFIRGKLLQDVLAQEKRLSPERSLEIMEPIMAGVGAAHRLGIVHRDLKPLNIIIEDELPLKDAVKVLDFGLAKIKTGELLGSFVAAKSSGVMGSPPYMAPEQWSDEEFDWRTDIYSLGIILYQMLAGTVPFKGTSAPTIMKKHLMDEPPRFVLTGVSVPPHVEAVVRHALEKNPANRPQSVYEFIGELRAAIHEPHPREGAQSVASSQLDTLVPDTVDFQAARGHTFDDSEIVPHVSGGAGQSYETTSAGRRAEEEERQRRLELERVAEEKERYEREEEARRAAEERRQKEEERKLAEEAQKRAAEEARKLAEEDARRRAAQEQARRREAEEAAARAAEKERLRKEEEDRQQREEEARRVRAVEAARRAAEERRQKEEERKLAEEAERKRKKEEEECTRAAEEAKKRAAEEAERKRQEEEARQKIAEEERRRQAEAERQRQAEAAAAERKRQKAEAEQRAAEAWAAQEEERRQAAAQIAEQQGLMQSTVALPDRKDPAVTTPADSGHREKQSRGLVIALAALAPAVILFGLAGILYLIFSSREPDTGTANSDVNVTANTNAEISGHATPKQVEGGLSVKPPHRPELVEIPGGVFLMGRNDVSTTDSKTQYPAHEVKVRPFLIDRTEVTNAEYADFVRETRYKSPEHWEGNVPPAGEEMLPVVYVSFEDAQAFASWRSQRDGVTYRLPSEEEWEFAARGPRNNLYPWGNNWADDRVNLNGEGARPVGSFPQGTSTAGVLDMIGNVWEWTSSKASLYKGNDELIFNQKDRIVVRGGSYLSMADDAIEMRGSREFPATWRQWQKKDTKSPTLGFRLARDLP
jgi:formylglycine-generating enzyme required for sulfatase activity/serine/threonine protein kinase